MATTTASAIRTAMIRTVRQLTPATLPARRFEPHDERIDIRTWADNNPQAAWRRFSIRDTGLVDPPAVSDTSREWTETTFEVAVAYPQDTGRYGNLNLLSMDDVIESDQAQIANAIGTNGYATLDVTTGGDACVTTDGMQREPGVKCVFGVIRLRVRYWRAL